MTAFNVVRFRVKAGREKEFVEQMKQPPAGVAGLRKLSLVKTGERTYCFVGEWRAMTDIVASRPQMIGSLDKVRPLLEDLGGGLGVTDPVSGEAVFEITPK